jgi:drug/metabolite transporter (DMT)-like permease
MSILALFLVLGSVGCQVGGQVLFKLAMNHTHTGSFSRYAPLLAAGVGAMTVSFVLWYGLLSKFQLSQLYPFEGVERVMVVVAAAIFLREKITPRLLVGVLLICAGIALVSGS